MRGDIASVLEGAMASTDLGSDADTPHVDGTFNYLAQSVPPLPLPKREGADPARPGWERRRHGGGGRRQGRPCLSTMPGSSPVMPDVPWSPTGSSFSTDPWPTLVWISSSTPRSSRGYYEECVRIVQEATGRVPCFRVRPQHSICAGKEEQGSHRGRPAGAGAGPRGARRLHAAGRAGAAPRPDATSRRKRYAPFRPRRRRIPHPSGAGGPDAG